MKTTALIAAAVVIVLLAAGSGFAEDAVDRAEQRLDLRADANGHENRALHLDRKGDRIENRLDRKGDRIDHRLDSRGQRVDRRYDRRNG